MAGSITVTASDSPYSVTCTIPIILVDSSAGAIELRLPSSNSAQNRSVRIIKISNDSNLITITPFGSDVIDQDTSFTFTNKLAYTLSSFGSGNWALFNGNAELTVYPKDFGAAGDGTTDDGTAFQNAINFLNGLGGGTLIVPYATYRTGTTLDWKSNVFIYGDGLPTIKLTDTFPASTSHNVLYAADANDIKVDGIIFDGNFAATSTASTTAFTMGAIRVAHCSRVTISNCYFQNGIGKGNYIGLLGNDTGGNTDVTIIGNSLTGGGISGSSYPIDHIYIQNATNTIVKNNILRDWSDTGIGLEHQNFNLNVSDNSLSSTVTSSVDAIVFSGNGDADNIIINRNIITSKSFGIAFREMLGPNGYNIRNVEICSNIINGYESRGITVKGLTDISTTTFRQVTNVVISNNIVMNPGTAGNDNIGIVIDDYVNDVIVSNNIVRDTLSYGMAVVRDFDTSATKIHINNNEILNPGQKSGTITTANSGILVSSTGTLNGLIILDNNIYGDSVNMAHGIYLDAGDLTRSLIENKISGMAPGWVAYGKTSISLSVLHTQLIEVESGVTNTGSTPIIIAHGLSFPPKTVFVTAMDSGPTDIFVSGTGSNNFNINFGGGGNYAFSWRAQV